MDRIKIIYLVLLIIASSCSKDFLDKTPDEDLTIEDVFSERRNAEQYLSNTYTHVPEEIDMRDITVGSNPFTGAADELESTWTVSTVFQNYMNTGAWSSSDNIGFWAPLWRGIRKTNIFLENVDKIPLTETFNLQKREQWKGEATFLRAFYHFLLMRIYGPIPIVDHTVPLDEDFETLSRSPIQDVVNFVVKDCEQASLLMPYKLSQPSVESGRATASAAMALRSRVLLYMASPLWNALKADGVSKDMEIADFTDKKGLHLFPQELNANRWKMAADAALLAINKCTNDGGNKLFTVPDNDPVANYQQLFLAVQNAEVIFAKNVGRVAFPENQMSPNGMGGTSGSAPMQEIVDEYEMQATGLLPITGYNPDGTAIINAASGYKETGYTTAAHPKGYYPTPVSNMYVGRDPRFYASINFNGQYWRTRVIQFYRPGADGFSKSTTNFTKTGYLMKKGSSPSVNLVTGILDNKNWIFFRLGELYLNYAEALNEAEGPVSDVYKYVNAIRTRVNMPALPAGLSKDAMREKIRHERRIELAFETHRYFDTHRWRLSEIVQNQEIHGLNYTSTAATAITSDIFYKRMVIEKRVFESPKHYFWPIPLTDIVKSPGLVQNIGW